MVLKSVISNTDIINNNIINTSSCEVERTEELIREQIEYDCIVHNGNRMLVDEIVMVISDIICGTAPTVRIGRDYLPRNVVISRFRKLNSEHILFIISGIENNISKIKNMKSFLVSALYNTPATMEIEITSEFMRNNRFG